MHNVVDVINFSIEDVLLELKKKDQNKKNENLKKLVKFLKKVKNSKLRKNNNKNSGNIVKKHK